ncbi:MULTISPECIES: BTAD domain-containing putative transcriptional regulator [unclassified Streptomyces]|uniref:AfsR/SARP family transcriptional regulator n=1 Tax=unclassified Streptomyces TaxID=2593676 RepID=UPI001F52108F|nr:BTAD domain-containing putative transcriptional regulator [Streptomyces sp. TSRI0281]
MGRGDDGLPWPQTGARRHERNSRAERGPAMGALVEFEIRILGSIELRVDGRRDPLGTAKERAMIAALAVDAGRPVALDSLVHRLWDDAPPAKPRASLHVYAARIRRRLGERAGGPTRIVQQAHTYSLVVDPDSVDSHRFQRLTAEALARSDDGDGPRALALLREADSLWRGDPLTGMPGLWAESVRTNLLEKRLAATLARVGIELRTGRYAELVPDLSTLFELHPTDETLAGHLMVANYGCGRQADALRTFDTVRRRLGEEFGSDPGEALTRLYQLILNRVPVSGLLSGPEPVTTAPHTLPSHGDLVGRDREMLTLLARPPAGSVIALQTISGMGGVGKTLLALHAARALAPHYPDGQLHLDLSAHTADGHPLSPESALTRLLRDFGVPVTDLPDDLEGLVSLWRTLLSTRRSVIVLDDAADAEQVAPLLPGTSESLLIITSRRRLTGLPGIRSLFLDVLPADDASTLFRRLVGPERTSDLDEVADIVRLCGHLPLAVEIAAGRLGSRPSWTTSHLIEKLSREHGRLNEIRDGYRKIAGVFEMSYHTLGTEERTIFRQLSLHFGPDFTPHSAAALTGLPLEETERVLDSLLDAHLLQEPAPERFRFHDLVGECARSLSATEDRYEGQLPAVRRMIDFYVHGAEKADRLIYPRRLKVDIEEAATEFALPEWQDASAARHWLVQEHGALVAAEHRARGNGLTRQAARLAHALAAHLDEEGYWGEARPMHTAAAEFWHESGERRPEALALIDLGTTLARAGRYEAALAAGHAAMRAAGTLDDPATDAEARHLLGVIHWHMGQLDEALSFQNQTLERRLRSGDIWQLARTRNNLGITHLFLGNHTTSMEFFVSALGGFRRSGDAREEFNVLNNLSDLHFQTGDRESARRLLKKSLSNPRLAGTPLARATGQVNLANTMEMPEEVEAALDLYREALLSFRQLGDRRNASITLHRMGVAFEESGNDDQAVAHHERALDLATGIGAGHERMLALRGMAAAERRLGRTQSAARHLAEALTLAQHIGAMDEAARTQAEFAALQEESEGAGTE